MSTDPKHLLYRTEEETTGSGLPSYYIQSGDGDSRRISASVWQAFQLVPLSAARVLDVGCHVGYLGQMLKAARPIEVVGIELDPEVAQVARQHLDQVVEADIERVEALPFPEASFDCVTILDVVEHFVLPQRVLALVRRYLKPTGCLICSIPNVRHMSVVAGLLSPGRRWTVEGHGMVTDPPHLRFFTLDDLVKLMADTGYQMANPVVGTCSDPDHPFIRELIESLQGVSAISAMQRTRLKTELSIFQFVFRADVAPLGAPQAVQDLQLAYNQLFRVDTLVEAASLRGAGWRAIAAARQNGARPVNKLIDAADLPEFEAPAHGLQALRAKFEALRVPYSRHLSDTWSRMWEYSMMVTVSQAAEGMRVLDVGGTGTIFAYYLAVLGCQVHTIDIDEHKVQAAAELAQQVPAFGLMQNQRMSVLDMSAYRDHTFDRVFAVCVIEHLPSREAQAQAMREMVRVLKPGGLLGLTYDVVSPAAQGFPHMSIAGEVGGFETAAEVETLLFKPVADVAAIYGNTPVLWGALEPRSRAPEDFYGSIGTLFLVKK